MLKILWKSLRLVVELAASLFAPTRLVAGFIILRYLFSKRQWPNCDFPSITNQTFKRKMAFGSFNNDGIMKTAVRIRDRAIGRKSPPTARLDNRYK